MNQTSRTDEPYEGDDGWNQSPNALSGDLVTNQDLNGIANSRERRGGHEPRDTDGRADPAAEVVSPPPLTDKGGRRRRKQLGDAVDPPPGSAAPHPLESAPSAASVGSRRAGVGLGPPPPGSWARRVTQTLGTFGRFVGPGFLVAVAYIDPGNYSTDISAGAQNRFRLLFVVLVSNLFAVFLQCLAAKLGTVTGLNLAQACRLFLPRWLNLALYALAEVAIVATDVAEVIGTAIGLNLLVPGLPLVAGCALSIVDVMVILWFYRPDGPMRGLRCFEWFVMALVLAVVVCFCIQLGLIRRTSPAEVFRGYVPNDAITRPGGIFQACGILGATVMPHSLYLGSGIVQSRLRDYDSQCGLLPPEPAGSVSEEKAGDKTYYIPSLRAIRHSLKYSYAEITLSLVTFALFVNSAILIVAGASLYGNPDALSADIFGIHALLARSISPGAGTIFALALLFSGVSAGVVCTIAGQMVCEGALRWQVRPWLRRLATRSLSITPSIVIAGATGRGRLNAALNGTQVALSIVLPFVSAPLIWFTCRHRYMTVRPGRASFVTEEAAAPPPPPPAADEEEVGEEEGRVGGRDRALDRYRRQTTANAAGGGGPGDRGPTSAGASDGGEGEEDDGPVSMANSWWVCVLAVLVWLMIVIMNVANLVLLGMGES
ncbi:natural resistance-associated macrophage protein-domain-containing protein [Xylariaceae sp. FL0804]|nr:natural resistance-associated macrophage protein-domain-containing protein [Xylariaceae sp. FL0804]